jgi:hypothetical protein
LGGNFDISSAIGSDSTADVGIGGSLDTSFADGANSDAQALGVGDIAAIINTDSGFDQAISGANFPLDIQPSL